MKVVKRVFSFNLKKSVDYDSVGVNEGVEVEVEDGESIDELKAEVIRNVKDILQEEIKKKKNLLGG